MARRVIISGLMGVAQMVDSDDPGPRADEAPKLSTAAVGSDATKSEVPPLLRPPFDADKAAIFREALATPEPMAAFIDFVISHLLPRDHKSVFWGDRMLTIDKAAGFMNEPAFKAAFERIHGAHQYDQYTSATTIAWRLHTLIWAARTALSLPDGDFVECGVFKGDMAWMVGEVTGFAKTGRQFHLYDSFEGFDPSQTTDEDFPDLPGFLTFANKIYSAEGLWEGVRDRFQPLPHYHLHKGYLPGTLDRDGFPERIAYLHIDLNVASVEIACLDRLFDHVVPGGVIIFDDYGWKVYHRQKDAEDAFFAERGYHILELPTGQGLAVKRAGQPVSDRERSAQVPTPTRLGRRTRMPPTLSRFTSWLGSAGGTNKAKAEVVPGAPDIAAPGKHRIERIARMGTPALPPIDRTPPIATPAPEPQPVIAALAPFDGDHGSEIARIGFHPFIMVRHDGGEDPEHRFVVCPTQNEAGQFVAALAALPHFAESKLLRGIERALQLKIYDAAALLFAWTQSQADGLNETVYVGKPDDLELPQFHGYPAFGVSAEAVAGGSSNRVQALAQTFHAYQTTSGNDALRFAIMQALALGLSRALGFAGQYEQALPIIDAALTCAPESVHLKAAKHAVTLAAAGNPVPARLEHYIGSDNGYGDFASEIERIGFHPFIMVHRDGERDRQNRLVVCPTQNEVGQFVAALAALPRFAASKLLRGIERALRLEIYDAAALLFAWTQSQSDGLNETVYVDEPDDADLARLDFYPAFEFSAGANPAQTDDRIRILVQTFHAYEAASGNDGLRFALIESLALALSRALGLAGQWDEALPIIDAALGYAPESAHLNAAKHTLMLAAAGNPVPARLRHYIGNDNGYGDLIAEIERIGFQPFVMVRRNGERDRQNRFVVCPTQNDAGRFVGALAALPRFADSKLLRGIERALQLEIYDAAALLFAWTQSQANGLNETVYVSKPEDADLARFDSYPAFEFSAGPQPGTTDDRVGALVQTFHAYESASGNDALRFAIIEAIAFALSRTLGSRRQYDEALPIVDAALAHAPSSIHLKAAKHVLLLAAAGKPVPPRLEKYIGEDSGYLKQFVCPQPFERFDIGPDGNVLVCCGHWLPTSIGNFMTQPVEDVLNSPIARKIRQSMTDGSYKYCNHLECGTMAQESLPRRDEIPYARTRAAVARGDFKVDSVDEVMFAFDQTCNLSCPSCRTHVITEKASQSLEKARAVEEKLLPLLPTLRVLNLNPAGELFGSRPSRKLLELINDDRCPDLRLDIISNGTLFSEEEWNKFPGIHNKIRSVRISTDAAHKATFEKLRRLGKYEIFCNNMRFLRSLRERGVIPQFKMSFTYQLDNFREMRDFVAFCDEMHADFAIFERLQNIAFSNEAYRQRAVHYPDHPLYAEFINGLKDPVFRTKRVWHDFDYDGVEKMTGDEARDRLAEALVTP